MIEKPESCVGCSLHSGEFGKKFGYVQATGSGENGVLIVIDSCNEDEEASGMGFTGKAAQYLFSCLKRAGIERDGFRLHSMLSCHPPNNKLVKMAYTESAICHCRPNLTRTILEHISASKARGLTPVILSLGRLNFMEIMGIDQRSEIMRKDYHAYPHWHGRFGCWVVASHSPVIVMGGKHYLAPTLQFATQRALEIAAQGLILPTHDYLLDPAPHIFAAWAQEYLQEQARNPDETFLSYDIETPYKSGKDETEIEREDDDDFTILRCSFSYKPGQAVSVPWTAEYMATIEKLFGTKAYAIGWNNCGYDDVRIRTYMPMEVVSLDAMLAWHVLNTSLPKGLGFVTPFYWHETPMWKHLSDAQPAFYNAKDADAALRCWLGIRRDLKENGLWGVFNEHVVKLNEVLAYMSGKGVLMDMEARQQAEVLLTEKLDGLEQQINHVVPIEAKELKIYKKTPKSTEDLIKTVGVVNTKYCAVCGVAGVTAAHFKSVGKKALKGGVVENPCHGGVAIKGTISTTLWAQPLPFKLSTKRLQAYQKFRKHTAVMNREKKISFDIGAIKKLIKKYPDDALYSVIGEYRGTQKLIGTYVGRTATVQLEVPDTYKLKAGERWVE